MRLMAINWATHTHVLTHGQCGKACKGNNCAAARQTIGEIARTICTICYCFMPTR